MGCAIIKPARAAFMQHRFNIDCVIIGFLNWLIANNNQ